MSAPLQVIPSLPGYRRPLHSQNPEVMMHIRDIIKEEKELDKQIKMARSRINYIRNRNRIETSKRERQSKNKSVLQEKSELVRIQKDRIKEQKEIEGFVREPKSRNRTAKIQNKKYLDFKATAIEFIPGSDKSHPKRLEITSSGPFSKTPGYSRSPSPSPLKEKQEKIKELRTERELRLRDKVLWMYQTNHDKAQQLRNEREGYKQLQIEQYQRRVSMIKEKEQILSQRLQISKKFRQQCLQEYLITKQKYRELNLLTNTHQ